MRKNSIFILFSLMITVLFFVVPAHAEERIQKLTDSLSVEYQSYQKSFENDVSWNIEFPVISGFEDEKLEKIINQKIRSFFMSGPKTDREVLSLNGSAESSLIGSVGIFSANSLYKSGDKVYFWRDSISIDLLTGRVFTLDNLLLKGYQDELNDLLKSIDADFKEYETYRFTEYGVRFYTEGTSDNFLYLSYTKMSNILDKNGLCYTSLKNPELKTEKVSKLPFKDVQLSHWAYPYIYEAYTNSIMTGTNNMFLPDKSMTGAEFCVAILRSMGLENDAKILYNAVPQGEWYSASINKAFEIGLLDGIIDDFYYEEPITRENAMVILANMLKYKNNGKEESLSIDSNRILQKYTDIKQMDKIKRQAAAVCVDKELISGTNDKLMPKGEITRAQAAKILCSIEKL